MVLLRRSGLLTCVRVNTINRHIGRTLYIISNPVKSRLGKHTGVQTWGKRYARDV